MDRRTQLRIDDENFTSDFRSGNSVFDELFTACSNGNGFRAGLISYAANPVFREQGLRAVYGYDWNDNSVPLGHTFGMSEKYYWEHRITLHNDHEFWRCHRLCVCRLPPDIGCICRQYYSYYDIYERFRTIVASMTVNCTKRRKIRVTVRNCRRLFSILLAGRTWCKDQKDDDMMNKFTDFMLSYMSNFRFSKPRSYKGLAMDIANNFYSLRLEDIPHMVLGIKNLIPEALSAQSDTPSHNQRGMIDDLIREADKVVAQGWFPKLGIDMSFADSVYKNVMDIINKLKTVIFDKVTKAFNLTCNFITTIAYIVLTYLIITRCQALGSRTTTILYILLTIVNIYANHSDKLRSVYEWCKNKLSGADPDVIVSQGIANKSKELFAFVPYFILNLLNIPANVLSTLTCSKFLDGLLRKISFLGDSRLYQGIDNITDFLTSSIKTTCSYICDWIGYDAGLDLSSETDPILKWFDSCEKYIMDYNHKTLNYSNSLKQHLCQLYQEGMKYLRHPIYKKLFNQISTTLRLLLKLIEKANTKLNTGGTIRNPPVTLMFYGETGAGKSTLTMPLSIKILKEIFIREKSGDLLLELKSNWNRMIYSRAGEQEYWDGYAGQRVCVFDDWNQLADSVSNPSIELFELIRASNVFPYPLHMANLDDKAETNFTSDIIICSSNNKIPKTESLNYPEALIRRFNFFTIITRDENKTGSFSLQDFNFTIYDPKTLKQQPAMKVDEYVKKVVDLYSKNKNFVSSINEYVEKEILNFSIDDELSSEPKPGSSGLQAQGDDTPVSGNEEEWFDYNKSYEEALAIFRKRYPNISDDILRKWARNRTNKSILSDFDTFLCSGGIKRGIRELYDELGIKNIRIEYKEKYSWLNFSNILNIMLFVGCIISLGFALYTMFDSKAEKKHSAEKIDEYVRKRIYERKQKLEDEASKNQVRMQNEMESIKQVMEGTYSPSPRKAKTEGLKDVVADEMASKLLRSSIYKIYFTEDGETRAPGHVLFLRGKLFVMPKHFLHGKFNDKTIVSFSNTQGEDFYPIYFESLRWVEILDENGQSKDLVWSIHPCAREHPDITNYFVKDEPLTPNGTTEICLLTLSKFSQKENFVIDRKHGFGATCYSRHSAPIKYEIGDSNEVITIQDGWRYTTLETKSGDCGAPLIVKNNKIGPGKIVGIHVCGGISVGYSTVLTYKEVIHLTSAYQKVFAQCMTVPFRDAENPFSGQELIFYGKLDAPIVQPVRSKIQKSFLYKKIKEPFSDICWLKPGMKDGELFDPLDYRTKRMGKKSVPVDLKRIDVASKVVLDEFKRVYLRHKDRLSNRFSCPLSFEATCVGIPGEDFVNAIKRDTSCGFPFVNYGLTRKDIFGSDEVYSVDTPVCKKIFELVSFYEREAAEYRLYDHYFIDTLKDERKPKEKCHKSRMFAAGPIDYLVWSKRWYNGIVAVICELRNFIHVSVGTNAYSYDWDIMAKLLLSKSTDFIAGDFEGFDASQQKYILESACNVLIDFSQYVFGKDDYARVQMQAIAIGLYNSFHISKDNVIQWCKSLPSGHYLTSITNSIFVNIVMVASYMLAIEKQNVVCDFVKASEFYQKFSILAYGDDHIVGVPYEYQSIFNQNTLANLMLELGLYYTDELKSGEDIPPTRKLEDIYFLKRKFYFDEQACRWIAPLDLNVILETPMWIRQCPDERVQVFNNLEFSLRELSLHPKEVWDKWAPKLIDFAENYCFLVTKFSDQLSTKLFVLEHLTTQSFDVILAPLVKSRSFKRESLLSKRKTVDIYPYHTGSVVAAQHNPVTFARNSRLGDQSSETTPPAQNLTSENPMSNEIKDNQYVEQTNNNSVQQITTFENDKSTVVQQIPDVTPMPRPMRSMHTDDNQHTIASFLKRPMILREFIWNSSKTRNDSLFDPILAPSNMLVRQFKDKLQNFTSFRATAVITVQIQSQPFQAGRFILAAIPVPKLVGKRVKIIENRISNLTLIHNVQCDIAKQTEVTLEVPYVSPIIAYDLITGNYDWAKIVCKVYSPLKSVGNLDVEGIVYVSFKDIQLGAPSSLPINESKLFAQSDWAQLAKDQENELINEAPRMGEEVRQRALELSLPSSASASKVTGGLKKINKNISKYLSFTTPVTSFLNNYLFEPLDDFLGPVLSVFGLSKPLAEETDHLVLRPATNFSIFDGQDRCLSLASSNDVNAPIIPGLNSTKLDEMSFDYLKKIPQFIGTFKFSANTKSNDILYYIGVRPSLSAQEYIIVNLDGKTKIISQPNHLGYITQPFYYWTGSLVYTFRFVKTDFHSGRIEISFHPNCCPFSAAGTLKPNVQFDAVYRYIVDLREKSEISLRVPYIAMTPFKKNTQKYWPVTDIDHVGKDIVLNNGFLVIKALTPLKASSAVVSNDIEVLVEMNAGNDFSVMSPLGSKLNPITPLEEAITTTSKSLDVEDENLKAQSDEASKAGIALSRQKAIEGYDPPSITSNVGEIQSTISSYLVTGEVFKNFRDLCHRTNFVERIRKTANMQEQVFRFYAPPPILVKVNDQKLVQLDFADRANSALTYVGAMFALARGSVRVRILTSSEQIIGARLVSETSTFSDCLFPRVIEKSAIKGIAEYQLPFYCRSYQIDHLKYNKSDLIDFSFGASTSGLVKTDWYIATSGGDDINFGLFIGTPLCMHPATISESTGADPFEPEAKNTDGTFVLWDHIFVS